MYSSDLRVRVSEYDRMRAERQRVDALLRKSHSLKKRLRSRDKTSGPTVKHERKLKASASYSTFRNTISVDATQFRFVYYG